MKAVPKVALLAVSAAAAAALFYATTVPNKQDQPATIPPPTKVAQSPPEAPAAAPTTAPPPTVTLAAHVDSLLKSPRPVDALTAYKLLAACVAARESNQNVQQACGDVSPGQIVSRRLALYRAAEAGVHGAAKLAIALGPDDYALHKIDNADPVFKDWEQHVHKALEAGVRTGDRFSLLSMAQINEGTPDKALMYWSAVAEQSKSPAFQKEVERRAKTLPPDRASSAIEAGRQIAMSFKPEGETQ